MLKDKILKILAAPHYVPLDSYGLRKKLQFKANRDRELVALLNQMERDGKIARLKGNRFALPVEADLIPGRIWINRRGIGIHQPDDPKLTRLTIPADATNTAFHGDRVLVRREVERKNEEPKGTVVKILERGRKQIVGTLQKSKQFHYVIPDDPRIPHDIYVAPAQAAIGDKVVVELLEWKARQLNPEGKITEVLGRPEENGVDILSIVYQYGLHLNFPEKVRQEAAHFGRQVTSSDLKGRKDCRQQEVITIDPDDAKDFDDAICLEQVDSDRWRLWVHIADVSHYVKPGSSLDKEARRRGNSTYLVDRVIPMLPEELSNELCSLKPHVDRLTKCVEFLLTKNGRVLKTEFYSAVIHSKRRYTYREVLAILNRAPVGTIEEMLHQTHRLAQRIRSERMKAGSLDLDFPEKKIYLNDFGKVDRVVTVENDISHQLIEEFMLLANEAVAARLKKIQRPAIYRIHESPDPKRLREYREEIKACRIACGDLLHRPEVQKLLKKLNESELGSALKIGFLRSLRRARYATEPLGHYGLAKTNYTHFTSPIRRYADLIVHRALFNKSRVKMFQDELKKTSDHISMTERNSADAEQDSRNLKLFAFLQEQIEAKKLSHYTGLITDVRNFGFFVDIGELGLSGLVPTSSLKDDFYIFDFAKSRLVGRKSRRVLALGDNVEVKVGKIDFYKKQVDFVLVGNEKKLK